MTTRQNVAEDEYARLLRRIRGGGARDGDSDLYADEERVPLAVHDVEVAREERRRHGVVEKEVSRQEFAAQLGIDLDDTRHPDSGKSVLEVTEETRAYYGDPEDAIYRAFRREMMRHLEDTEWLKSNNFVTEDIASEIAYVKRRRSQT